MGWNWEIFDSYVKKAERWINSTLNTRAIDNICSFMGASHNVDEELLTYDELLHGSEGGFALAVFPHAAFD